MRKPQDITGKQFGRLVALERLGPRTKRGCHYWLCECECGNKHEVQIAHLNSGNVRSCGCLSKVEDAELNNKYYHYGYDAKRRGYKFDLSKEDFKLLIDTPCHYCGSDTTRNGIDRIDSTHGYTLDNCVSCCKICNRMKMDIDYEKFTRHVQRIYRYRVERKDDTAT